MGKIGKENRMTRPKTKRGKGNKWEPLIEVGKTLELGLQEGGQKRSHVGRFGMKSGKEKAQEPPGTPAGKQNPVRRNKRGGKSWEIRNLKGQTKKEGGWTSTAKNLGKAKTRQQHRGKLQSESSRRKTRSRRGSQKKCGVHSATAKGKPNGTLKKRTGGKNGRKPCVGLKGHT